MEPFFATPNVWREGTTGTQAADLVGRKIVRDGGAAARSLIARMRVEQGRLDNVGATGNAAIAEIGRALDDSLSELEAALRLLVECRDSKRCAVGAVPFLELFGIVTAGSQMGLAALAAQRRLAKGGDDVAFPTANIATARFYAAHVLPRASDLRTTSRSAFRHAG
jgi:3-(methylthio)propanoyl-CoA dehydrogenase